MDPFRDPQGPAWRCVGHACPKREPAIASSAPTCYTCGRAMEKVAPPILRPIEVSRQATNKFAVRLAAACDMPLTLLFGTSPVEVPPTLLARKFAETDEELRERCRLELARGKHLDELGKLVGVKRQSGEPARMTSAGMIASVKPETDDCYRERIRIASLDLRKHDIQRTDISGKVTI